MASTMSGRVRFEQLVVAADVRRVVGEALAAEVALIERVALDQRAHRAVEDDDPLEEQLVEPGQAARAGEGPDERAVGGGGHACVAASRAESGV